MMKRKLLALSLTLVLALALCACGRKRRRNPGRRNLDPAGSGAERLRAMARRT